jgi:hypothetical protein
MQDGRGVQADAGEAERDGREAGQGCCSLPRSPSLWQETPAPCQEALGFKVSLRILTSAR